MLANFLNPKPRDHSRLRTRAGDKVGRGAISIDQFC